MCELVGTAPVVSAASAVTAQHVWLARGLLAVIVKVRAGVWFPAC